MPENIEKILRGCFHPKEGRPNLHKVPVNTERSNDDVEWIIEDAKDFVLKIEEVLA